MEQRASRATTRREKTNHGCNRLSLRCFIQGHGSLESWTCPCGETFDLEEKGISVRVLSECFLKRWSRAEVSRRWSCEMFRIAIVSGNSGYECCVPHRCIPSLWFSERLGTPLSCFWLVPMATQLQCLLCTKSFLNLRSHEVRPPKLETYSYSELMGIPGDTMSELR